MKEILEIKDHIEMIRDYSKDERDFLKKEENTYEAYLITAGRVHACNFILKIIEDKLNEIKVKNEELINLNHNIINKLKA